MAEICAQLPCKTGVIAGKSRAYRDLCKTCISVFSNTTPILIFFIFPFKKLAFPH